MCQKGLLQGDTGRSGSGFGSNCAMCVVRYLSLDV